MKYHIQGRELKPGDSEKRIKKSTGPIRCMQKFTIDLPAHKRKSFSMCDIPERKWQRIFKKNGNH